MASSEERLGILRTKINDCDRSIIAALGQRFALTREVGVVKAANHLPAYDQTREKQVYETLSQQAIVYDIPDVTVKAIYKHIMDASKNEHLGFRDSIDVNLTHELSEVRNDTTLVLVGHMGFTCLATYALDAGIESVLLKESYENSDASPVTIAGLLEQDVLPESLEVFVGHDQYRLLQQVTRNSDTIQIASALNAKAAADRAQIVTRGRIDVLTLTGDEGDMACAEYIAGTIKGDNPSSRELHSRLLGSIGLRSDSSSVSDTSLIADLVLSSAVNSIHATVCLEPVADADNEYYHLRVS